MVVVLVAGLRKWQCWWWCNKSLVVKIYLFRCMVTFRYLCGNLAKELLEGSLFKTFPHFPLLMLPFTNPKLEILCTICWLL